MARPWKHPKTGIYWLRRGVPDDLRALVGKREEKRSLRTSDPAEARRRHAEALAEIEIRWSNLRAGPVTLTEREAHEMAEDVHDRWLATYKENPSEQKAWRTDLAGRLWSRPSLDLERMSTDLLTLIDMDGIKIGEMEDWSFQCAGNCLRSRGLVSEVARQIWTAG